MREQLLRLEQTVAPRSLQHVTYGKEMLLIIEMLTSNDDHSKTFGNRYWQ